MTSIISQNDARATFYEGFLTTQPNLALPQLSTISHGNRPPRFHDNITHLVTSPVNIKMVIIAVLSVLLWEIVEVSTSIDDLQTIAWWHMMLPTLWLRPGEGNIEAWLSASPESILSPQACVFFKGLGGLGLWLHGCFTLEKKGLPFQTWLDPYSQLRAGVKERSPTRDWYCCWKSKSRVISRLLSDWFIDRLSSFCTALDLGCCYSCIHMQNYNYHFCPNVLGSLHNGAAGAGEGSNMKYGEIQESAEGRYGM